GTDVLGQAATGTGKTASFAFPILDALEGGDRGKNPVALVLVPTRELALQVSQAFHSYGRAMGARLVAVYGGAPARHQIDALRRGTDVVVATPGRAIDLNSRGALRLDAIRTVVLDEADEMLEMGFIEDIEAILAMTPNDRQTVLFSATMPKRIDALANRHLRSPARISVKTRETTDDELPRVRQAVYGVSRAHKAAALGRILDAEDPAATIVFCRTRGGVDELTNQLTGRGYQAEALHGGLSQEQRDRVMGRLRSGATELLVATDVAARGLDVDLLTHVVNYDLPVSPEAYIHRIGRVGRAGREGVALSLVEPREKRLLTSIEKLLRKPIPVERLPTTTDVRQLRMQRTRGAVEALLNDADAQSRLEPYRSIVSELEMDRDPRDVAAALFAIAHESTQGTDLADDDRDLEARLDEPSGKRESGSRGGDSGERGGGSQRKQSRREKPSGPVTRIFISIGRKAGVTPGDLVGAITAEAGVKGGDIGSIAVHEVFSVVDVSAPKARQVVRALQRTKIRGRKATVRLDDQKNPR
ncbi:MAG: DEAD/DEAH box helicase, partial [Actinomycetes bacterium]